MYPVVVTKGLKIRPSIVVRIGHRSVCMGLKGIVIGLRGLV